MIARVRARTYESNCVSRVYVICMSSSKLYRFVILAVYIFDLSSERVVQLPHHAHRQTVSTKGHAHKNKNANTHTPYIQSVKTSICVSAHILTHIHPLHHTSSRHRHNDQSTHSHIHGDDHHADFAEFVHGRLHLGSMQRI